MNIEQKLIDYLYEVLGVQVTTSPICPNSIPFVLSNRYSFYELFVLSESFLMLFPKSDEELTPAIIQNDVQRIQTLTAKKVIVVFSHLPSFYRKRLIEYKIQFIVPGNQMYLPLLAIDFREHFYLQKQKPTTFTPSTQLLLLFFLQRLRSNPVTPTKLSEWLHFTSMTMSRSLDEIESAGLGETSVEGKERIFYFKKLGRELWAESLSHMRSPVKKQIWIKNLPHNISLFKAGETALAFCTEMAPPKTEVLAISKDDWKLIESDPLTEQANFSEDAMCLLQVWSYSPSVLSVHNTVDRCSLFLSLKDIADERVHRALDDMVKGIEW